MPILARPWIVGASVVYLAAVLAIGIWAARRTHSARDFFIAGQGIGLVVTGLATMSAAFSGVVFVGGPGLTYRLGVAALWIILPVGFTAGLLCWVLGKRLRLLAGVREVYTIPDAIACRFRSRAAAGLAAVAVAFGSIAYLGSQLLALGILLQAIFGLDDLAVAMGIGLLVLALYSAVGGMVAGVYTDVLQGGIMLVAAVAVFARALGAAGGWHALTRSIVTSETFGRAFLEPGGGGPLLTACGFFFVFGVGVLGQPQMLHKFYMLDDPRKLRWLPLVLSGSQALCLLIWIGLGLAVPALIAQGRLAPLARADDAAPAFLLGHAPEVLAGITFAAVLAAIMSTSDSFINIGSAALVRDLPRALGRPIADELLWGRVAVVGIGVVAAVFAWAYGDLVALLGTFAFGTFASALAPALAVGLNWRRVTATAAVASMATGLVLNLGLELWAKQTLFPELPGPPLPRGALPAAVSLAASFTVLLAVSWIGGAREAERIDADVRAVMDA